MDLENLRERVVIIIMIGFALFIVLTMIAMILYPGGTYNDSSTTGYIFWENYFSDTGRTVSHSGKPNTISSLLFTIAFVTMGISFIIFCILITHHFAENRVTKWLSIIGSILGIIGGIFFIGIAFTPVDLLRNEHLFFVEYSANIGFGAVIMYIICIVLNKSYPRKYLLVYVVFTLIIVLYIATWYVGPDHTTREGLIIQVTMQKIVLYSMIVCFLIQSYGIWQLEKSNTS